MKQLINLTLHPIRLVAENGEEWVIPPSGIELRVVISQERAGDWNGVPILKSRFGPPAIPIHLLPGWDEGALYVVSALTARSVALHYPEHANRFLVPGRTLRGTGSIVARALIVTGEGV